MALADLLVRPCGAASTYFRCALGANGNLGCPHRTRKGVESRKVRSLRILNNQHFHSALCNLWITPDGPFLQPWAAGRSRRAGFILVAVVRSAVGELNVAERRVTCNQVAKQPGCTLGSRRLAEEGSRAGSSLCQLDITLLPVHAFHQLVAGRPGGLRERRSTNRSTSATR